MDDVITGDVLDMPFGVQEQDDFRASLFAVAAAAVLQSFYVAPD